MSTTTRLSPQNEIIIEYYDQKRAKQISFNASKTPSISSIACETFKRKGIDISIMSKFSHPPHCSNLVYAMSALRSAEQRGTLGKMLCLIRSALNIAALAGVIIFAAGTTLSTVAPLLGCALIFVLSSVYNAEQIGTTERYCDLRDLLLAPFFPIYELFLQIPRLKEKVELYSEEHKESFKTNLNFVEENIEGIQELQTKLSTIIRGCEVSIEPINDLLALGREGYPFPCQSETTRSAIEQTLRILGNCFEYIPQVGEVLLEIAEKFSQSPDNRKTKRDCEDLSRSIKYAVDFYTPHFSNAVIG